MAHHKQTGEEWEAYMTERMRPEEPTRDADEQTWPRNVAIVLGVAFVLVVMWLFAQHAAEVDRLQKEASVTLEALPPMPGMILVHEPGGRATRISVQAIKSYGPSGRGSIIRFSSREGGLFAPAAWLEVTEAPAALDQLIRVAKENQ
jgi:hypothetical protein